MIIRPASRPLPLTQEQAQRARVLDNLNSLLQYSINRVNKPPVHTLITLRSFTSRFVKALSDTRRAEFYFPIRQVRSLRFGVYFMVLSVLRREDNDAPIEWDGEGLPTRNAKLVDDMMTALGVRWRYGWPMEQVRLIYTPSAPVSNVGVIKPNPKA